MTRPQTGCSTLTSDPRLLPPAWSAASPGRRHRMRLRLFVLLCLPLALFYFAWLLDPARIGNPVLYALLIAAELFNLMQAIGFWWTCTSERSRPPLGLAGEHPDVDVLVPVYDEPVDIVEPTLAAARRHARRTRPRLAARRRRSRRDARARAAHRARLPAPQAPHGREGGQHQPRAAAHALAASSSCWTATTCRSRASCRRRSAISPAPDVAFVQTPQCYANAASGELAAAAWSQQALFFGAIARGKDGHGAMFCCGTNVVFRRAALEDAGGFPRARSPRTSSCPCCCTSAAGRQAYVPEVLARGSAPRTWPPTSASSTAGRAAAWAPSARCSARGCRCGCARSTCSRARTS